jgi:hypothetical protein
MAEEFYHFMSRGAERLTDDSFADLKRLPLFRGLGPVVNDKALQAGKLIREVMAVRVGMSGGAYVISRFQLIQIAPVGGSTPPVFYIRTLMKSRDDKAVPRSHGIVLPRQTDVYFAQYHFGASGLNITAIPNSELADAERPFWRGLVLAVDRDTGQGALASRIALIPMASTPGSEVIGTLTRRELRTKFEHHKAICEMIIGYLDLCEEVVLQPLADVTNRTPFESWKSLAAHASTESTRDLIEELSDRESRLRGRTIHPLRALSD